MSVVVRGFTAVEVGWRTSSLASGDGSTFLVREPQGRSARVQMIKSMRGQLRNITGRDTAAGEWGLQGPSRATIDCELFKPQTQLFGVAAAWPVAAGNGTQFCDAAAENATASVAIEDGCAFFCVVSSAAEPDSFALVELFDSETSFGKHLETPHFKDFIEKVRPIYVGDRTDTVKGPVEWKL
jgi:quinol monooxygenase YgiN